jgi:mRNA interferase MazF
MKRGDVVVVAAAGDYGKPRPAVIVQSDSLPDAHASLILCQMTTTLRDAPHLRITVAPDERNGLRTLSQIMADKPVTVERKRVSRAIGRLSDAQLAELDAALAFVMGLAD